MNFLKKLLLCAAVLLYSSINVSASSQLPKIEDMALHPITRIQRLERLVKNLETELVQSKASQQSHNRDMQTLQEQVAQLTESNKKHKATILATVSVFTTEMNVQRELSRRMEQSLVALTTVILAQSTQKDSSKSTASSEGL